MNDKKIEITEDSDVSKTSKGDSNPVKVIKDADAIKDSNALEMSKKNSNAIKILKKTVQGFSFFGVFLLFIYLTNFDTKGDGTGFVYGQIFFDALLMVTMGVSVAEITIAVRKSDLNCKPSPFPLAILTALSYPLIKFLNYQGFLLLIIIGLVLIFTFYIFDRNSTFRDMLVTLFIFSYIIVVFALALNLIVVFGMLPLLIAIGAAMASDVFAFYFGSLIKGPKIFPRISPKKTWAGSIFGIIGGALGSLVVYALFEVAKFPINSYKFNYTSHFSGNLYIILMFYSFLGAAVAFLSEIGDIFASKLKREFNIKDFGTLLKDHGGILDRIDSIVFAVLTVAAVMMFFKFGV